MTERHCYFFAGGASGGHLTPGLAVAAALAEHDRQCRLVFVGSDRALERRLVAAAGYEHRALPVESLRALWRNPLRFGLRNWRALRMAAELVENERPRAVIGLGGFASVPAVWAAMRRGVPTLLLEQNTLPGRATRSFSRGAQAVCTAFDSTASKLAKGSRVIVTGNPVRGAIAALARRTSGPDTSASPTLLVLGGSQGAESLNDAVVRMLARRLPGLGGWKIVHQTGSARHAAVVEAYRGLAGAHVIEPYFDDLSNWYREATLAISRAGATTLAELACAGCPAVLLPYRHAADNHQLANARFFEAAGAALAVEHERDPSATSEKLATTLAALLENPSRLAAMRQAMRTLARPDAASAVLAALQTVAAVPMK